MFTRFNGRVSICVLLLLGNTKCSWGWGHHYWPLILTSCNYLAGKQDKVFIKIRTRGLLFHCCLFRTLKHAHFWHQTRLSLLIKVVCPEELWSSLCRSSTQIDQGCLSWPTTPFLKWPSNFQSGKKTQFNRNSSIFSRWGEAWGGEGRPERGEGRVLIKKSGSSTRGRVCLQSKVFICLNQTPSWCDLRNERGNREIMHSGKKESQKKGWGGGADGWTWKEERNRQFIQRAVVKEFGGQMCVWICAGELLFEGTKVSVCS